MDGTVPPSPAPFLLTVRAVGDDLGLVLPAELVSRLPVAVGDTMLVTQTPTGLVVTALAPEVARHVRLGLEFMDEYDETFRALAK